MAVNLSPQLAGEFAVDGFVALENVLGEADLGLVEEAVSAWCARQIATWNGDAAADFLAAWRAAGSGDFRRSPFRNLIHPGFYAFLRSPALLAAPWNYSPGPMRSACTEFSMHAR